MEITPDGRYFMVALRGPTPVSAAGGHAYTGAERSDPHAATVIAKKPVRIR